MWLLVCGFVLSQPTAPDAALSSLSLTSPSVQVLPASAGSAAAAPLLFSSAHGGSCPPGPLRRFVLNGFRFALPVDMASDAASFRQMQVVWLGSDQEHRLLVNCMLNYNAHAFHLLSPTTYNLRRNIRAQSRTCLLYTSPSPRD